MAGYTEVVRLLDVTNLRGTALAFRSDVRRFKPPANPDPTLIDFVDRPFDSVTTVIDQLSRLETQLRTQGDRRAVFLTIYVRMTQQVRDGIERDLFAEPGWMRRYLISFANYYRQAFLAFERGTLGKVPDPWRIAFATAVRGDTLIIQDVLLGVNAHINYDLALAINDVGIDPNRAQKYADHGAINNILARLVDAQQDALADIYASGIDNIDAVFGRLDESLMLLSMTEGREQAWRIAVILTDIGVEPIASYARWVLRATATGGGFFILTPHLDSSLLRILRNVENDRIDLDSVLERVEEHINCTRS